MLSIACNKSNGPHESSSSLPTALQLVAALTEEEHRYLRAFAAKRLRRLQGQQALAHFLTGKIPEDLVHDALQKVLIGDKHPKKGRKLAVKNRQSPQAFMQCIMGIINSVLSHAVQTELRFPQISCGDVEQEVTPLAVPEWSDTAGVAERRDLQSELFTRLDLIARTEPSLKPIIRHWSANFHDTDRIAGPEFDQNLVHRVRQHARRIMHELGAESGLEPTGGVANAWRSQLL